jgi:hypothetical protein
VFISGFRRRARPSVKILVFSLAVFSAAVYVGWALLFNSMYEPLAAAAVVALLVTLFRFRGLRSGLPTPYGRGRVSIIDEKAASRSGVLLVLGGFISMVGLMASVVLIPPELYFVLLIGVIAGLPVSQAVFFAVVAIVEARSRSKIFWVTEETTKDERTVLVKTVEMVPRAQR